MAKAEKKAGKGMVKWDEELARYAQQAEKTESHVGSAGNYISTKGGRFSYQGTEMPSDTIRVIVVDHVICNSFYQGRYDPDNPSSPVCYALGREEDELQPHEQAEEPQHEDCDSCPMNQYGSADVGRGKACKNGRRLALILADDMDDIGSAELAYLNIPPTSLKAWAGFVKSVAQTMKRPPFGVVTDITLEDDDKDQFHIAFSVVEKIDDTEVFEAIMAKREEAEAKLFEPFTPNSELEQRRPAKPAPRGRAGARQNVKPPAKPAAKASAKNVVTVKSAAEAKQQRDTAKSSGARAPKTKF